MASPYLPTEQAVAQSSPEVLGIERQRKLADLDRKSTRLNSSH